MRVSTIILILAVGAALLTARAAAPTAADAAFFEAKIRPVLVESCYSCHSAQSERIKGGLLLDTREGLLKGGETGASIVPGEPEKSRLMVALRYQDKDLQMPPKEPLPPQVVADFERWIKMGAPDPRVGGSRTPGADAAANHWAFKPVLPRSPPKVANKQWGKGDVDAFLLADLEERGIQPAPPADKATLLRRASFDLIGLPPSPADLEAFLADESPDAFAKVVDRLLKSASFGERWGRHWLDLARYGDSNGLEINTPFPNAFRYRDYVIAAFNNDKPFDQFIREQLAGDLLPAGSTQDMHEKWIATGFLVIGPKAVNEPMREKLIADVVDEQIDVTTKTFLGLTVACARCHDHKFDPIPTRDYYALAGIFGSTATLAEGPGLGGPNLAFWTERPLGTADEAAALEKYNSELEKMTAELNELRERIKNLPGGIDSKELAGIVIDNQGAEVIGAWQKSNYSTNFVDQNYLHDGDTGKGTKVVRFRPEIPEKGTYEIRLAYTPRPNRATNVPVRIVGANGIVKTNYLNQRLAPAFEKAFAYLGLFDLDEGTNNTVEISNATSKGFVVVDAVQFIPVGGAAVAASMQPAMAPRMIAGMKSTDVTLVGTDQAMFDDKVAALRAKAPPPLPAAMAVRDAQVRNAKVAIRGDVQRLGEEVPRGFIKALDRGGRPSPVAFKPDASGRLELAEWIASAENPLTARVYVNRVWLHLFGQGLVNTPDNFGMQGEHPSNAHLLDYLARQFVAEGWSTKKLIRRLMLSSAYQMSAKHNPAAFARDPDNRLVWRMSRRRLQAEAFRDAILAVSGQLDHARGGAPLINAGNNPARFMDGSVQIPAITRRSVYLPILRNNVDDLLLVFDFADPHTPTGKRHITSAATQALYVMNSPFVQEQAKAWAQRLLGGRTGDDGALVRRAFIEAFTRQPNSFELQRASAFFKEFEEAAAVKEPDAEARRTLAWQAFCQALIASSEFRFLN